MTIKVDGLREFQSAMRAVDKNLPKELRLMFNEVASTVVNAARPMVPARTGTARASIRAKSQQRAAIVQGGGTVKAPYYGWLDFGGHVGRRHSVSRPKVGKDGRYIYPAYIAHRPEIERQLAEGLSRLVRESGLAVV